MVFTPKYFDSYKKYTKIKHFCYTGIAFINSRANLLSILHCNPLS